MNLTLSSTPGSLLQIVEDHLSQTLPQTGSEWEQLLIKLLVQAAKEVPLTSERLEITENAFEAVWKCSDNQQPEDEKELELTSKRLFLYSCLKQAQVPRLSEKEIQLLKNYLSLEQKTILEQFLLSIETSQHALSEVFSKDLEGKKSDWRENIPFLEKVDSKASSFLSSIKKRTTQSSEVLEHFLQAPLKQIEQLKELTSHTSKQSDAYAHSYATAVKFVQEVQTLQMLNIFKRSSQLSVRPCFHELYHSLEIVIDTLLQAGLVPLAAKVKELSFLLAEQPYTLVVTGEAKRGKSTLVNTIIGQPISTIRETLNETAVPISFKWGNKFKATVMFFSREEVDSLSLTNTERVALLADSKYFKLLGTTLSITEESKLAPYISAQSLLSSLVRDVEIRTPARALEKGLVIIDTPGLNSRSAIHNYLAYEKCLGADCLLLVLDALHPESASEAYLIEKISLSGRSSLFAAVLTGIDHLSEKSSISNALIRGQELLNLAAKLGQSVGDVAAIDAKTAMQQSIRSKGKNVPNSLKILFGNISSQKEKQDLCPQEEVAAISKKIKFALEDAIKISEEKRIEDLAKVPSEREIQFVCKQGAQLSKIRKQLLDRVLHVTSSFSLEIANWETSVNHQVDLWESECVLKVMEAARKYGEELGDEAIFDCEKWKIFDESVTPNIIRDCLNKTLSVCCEKEKLWKKKIEAFNDELGEIGTECQRKIDFSSRDFEQLPKSSLLIQKNLSALNSLVNKAFAFGAGVTVVQGDNLGLIARGLNSVLKGSPLLILSALLLIALKKFGQIDQCKKRLFRKKEENIAKWVASKKEELKRELLEEQILISTQFQEAVCNSFSLLIRNLDAQILLLENYGDLLSTMRNTLLGKDKECLIQLQEALRQADNAGRKEAGEGVARLDPLQKTPMAEKAK